MTTRQQARIVLVLGMMLISAVAASTRAESQPSPNAHDVPSVFDGVLSNAAGSSEISTTQLRAALTDSTAIILDARPYEEYVVSHIPGARAVPAKPGTTPAFMLPTRPRWRKASPTKLRL
jgi:3-mercaptopyruvate sulfurtransferase SseA